MRESALKVWSKQMATRSSAAAAVKVQSGTATRVAINGAAVADAYIRTIAEQGTKLLNFLNDIFQMSQDARKEFRLGLKAHLDKTREQIKGIKTQRDAAQKSGDVDGYKEFNGQLNLLQKGFDSAKVRISEATTFAQAVDSGYADFNVGDGYHKSIAKARIYRQAHAKGAGQEGETRGRKAKAPYDVLKATALKLIEEGRITHEELVKALKTLEKEVKGVTQSDAGKAAQEWQNKLTASNNPAPRAIGPSQQVERRKNKGTKAQMKAAGVPTERRTHDAPPVVQ
jgi:hypothetical protein